jgi:hypothetical protein
MSRPVFSILDQPRVTEDKMQRRDSRASRPSRATSSSRVMSAASSTPEKWVKSAGRGFGQ